MKDDKYYLEQAYLEAIKAEQIDEVPGVLQLES